MRSGRRPAAPTPPPLLRALPARKVRAVRAALLDWYRREQRDLPWRRTRDPYAVLVSEMMLRQQRVDRVVPLYGAFLGQFPDLHTLAAAPRAEVIRLWSAIGLNAHAVRLHNIARWSTTHNGGRIPETLDGLMALEGIGRYTAAAVRCFAYGRPEALVDTNVRRVLGRVFAGAEPAGAGNDRGAWLLAERLVPRRGPAAATAYDWNQGLMDLGALVCTARAPRCHLCPLRRWCSAHRGVAAGPTVVSAAAAGSPPAPAAGPPAAAGARLAERRALYSATAAAAQPAAAGPAHARKPRQYQGTRRWLRGRTVRLLAALPPGGRLSLAELAEQLGLAPGPASLLEVAESLERDGLVEFVRQPDPSLSLPVGA